MRLKMFSTGEEHLILAQSIGLTLIFLSEIVMGILPMYSPTFQSSKVAMGWANSFAAGIFLAAGIVHLLPEAVEKMDEYYGDLTKELPIAFVMVVVGYTAILMLERVMFAGHEEDEGGNDIEASATPGTQLVEPKDKERTGERSTSIVELVEDSRKSNNGVTYMLLFALTVHGVTEGLALGLQTSINSAWPLWLAIFTHNWAEALCLGVRFAASSVPRVRATFFITMFSLATPVGVVLGMMLHIVLSEVTVAYFMAFSCGTFLYFGATEVVVEEFSAGRTHWVKFGWFCIGIALMVCIKVFLE